jgi:uncharacterized protein (TIGR03000 family)
MNRSGLAWIVLLVVGSPLWAQSSGYPFPYSGYSFGSTFYPYTGFVSSIYGPFPSYQRTGTSLRPLASPLFSPPMFTPGFAPEGSNAMPQPDNRAHIWLHVPADAEVWFNGVKTKQTGEVRYYFSPALAAGKQYTYQVEVRWSKDGKPIEQKQQIDVRAGDALRLDLSAAPASKQMKRAGSVSDH